MTRVFNSLYQNCLTWTFESLTGTLNISSFKNDLFFRRNFVRFVCDIIFMLKESMIQYYMKPSLKKTSFSSETMLSYGAVRYQRNHLKYVFQSNLTAHTFVRLQRQQIYYHSRQIIYILSMYVHMCVFFVHYVSHKWFIQLSVFEIIWHDKMCSAVYS